LGVVEKTCRWEGNSETSSEVPGGKGLRGHAGGLRGIKSEDNFFRQQTREEEVTIGTAREVEKRKKLWSEKKKKKNSSSDKFVGEKKEQSLRMRAGKRF